MTNNKLLWTYWHQGIDEAPEIIHHCIKSFEIHHPDWQIYVLDKNTVNEFIEIPNIKRDVLQKIGLAHRSDLLRTKLLIKYGGVWADPTCFFTKSLNSWLPQYMDAGLFFFHKPGRDRIISNWFIASKPKHPFLVKLFKELCNYWNNYNFRNLGRKEKSTTEYWLNRLINRNLDWPRIWFHPIITDFFRLYPYMIYHFKVYDLIRRDSEIEEYYKNMNKFSADIPHKMQRIGLLEPLSEDAKRWVDQICSPLYKLNWKLQTDQIPEGSTLDYLIKQG